MTMSERLDHARSALTAYFEAKGEPRPEGPWDYEDTAASDLIADLLHLQKRLGLRDTERTLQTASLHFKAEEEEEPHQACGNNQSTQVHSDVFYVVTSSHGELTINTDGAVTARRLDNDDGGRHLGRIGRVVGGVNAAHMDKNIITVRVEGGLVQDVDGIPRGYALHVEDYDHPDDSHPSWDTEKECFVTIYEGAAT